MISLLQNLWSSALIGKQLSHLPLHRPLQLSHKLVLEHRQLPLSHRLVLEYRPLPLMGQHWSTGHSISQTSARVQATLSRVSARPGSLARLNGGTGLYSFLRLIRAVYFPAHRPGFPQHTTPEFYNSTALGQNCRGSLRSLHRLNKNSHMEIGRAHV